MRRQPPGDVAGNLQLAALWQDLFSEQELARLRFMRWVIHAPGWDTALDHPIPTQQQTATRAQGLPWMRGSLA
jgi:hypothetical protein